MSAPLSDFRGTVYEKSIWNAIERKLDDYSLRKNFTYFMYFVSCCRS